MAEPCGRCSFEDTGIREEVLGVDVEIDNDEDVYVTMRRVRKITNIDKNKCRNLRLISCIVDDMRGLQDMNLVNLELYQNQITKITSLNGMRDLEYLDLSYNRIRRVEGLEDCLNLNNLLLSNNKIEKMENIEHLTKLELIEFGSNRIREVACISHLRHTLRALWLGRNKITSMSMPYLPNLEILSLQCNRLSEWDTTLFDNCSNLKELYLSENNLFSPPEQILKLQKITTLDLSQNRIAKLDYISELHQLEELWLNNNVIESLEEIKKLYPLKKLNTMYLEHNPVKNILGDKYRTAILEILPNLKQLDALIIRN